MSQELTYVGVSDVKDLQQKLEDLEHVAGTLTSQSQQLEFFAESLESTGATLNIISESLQNQITDASKILENTNQSNNELLERILYCEDAIKFIMDWLKDKGLLPGQVETIDKTITLNNLIPGNYTLKYENEDGTETEIGVITIEE